MVKNLEVLSRDVLEFLLILKSRFAACPARSGEKNVSRSMAWHVSVRNLETRARNLGDHS